MGILNKALELLRFKAHLSKTHVKSSQIISCLLIIAGVLIVMYYRLDYFSPKSQSLIFGSMLVGMTLLTVLFCCAVSYKSWFTSEDSFYFTTAPLQFRQMYYYHWLEICIRFIIMFGPLFLTGYAFLAIHIYGWVLGLVAILAFPALLSFAVNLGFFLIFYLLYYKNRLVLWLVLLIATVALSGGLLYLWLISKITMYFVFGLLWILVHWLVPRFIQRVYYSCLDSAGVNFNFALKSPFLQGTVLHNRWLNPIFRSVLYKELLTDKRNAFIYLRYSGTVLFMLLYLPLSKVTFFSEQGLTAALIFFYFMVLANFHETYASTFIKEGNLIGFLLPNSRSWWFILAKYCAGILEILPLIIVASLLTWYRSSLGVAEIVSFAILLWLLCSAHIAVVFWLTIDLINMEPRDMGILAGMIYEYAFANVDPKVLYMYIWTMLLPILLIALIVFLSVTRSGMNLTNMWLIAGLTLMSVIICLYRTKHGYEKKLRQILS